MNENQTKLIPFNIEMPFPLNAALFNELLAFPQFELRARKEVGGDMVVITDGEMLFHLAVAAMKESGIAFSSPGNSPKRNFIAWLNNHFVANQFSNQIEVKAKHVELLCQLVKEVLLQSETVQQIRQTPHYQERLQIIGTDQLTEKGAMLIQELFFS